MNNTDAAFQLRAIAAYLDGTAAVLTPAPQPAPAPAPVPAPVPRGPVSAPGFDRMLRVDFDLASPPMVFDTGAHGGMGTNGILVASFTTPTAPTDHFQLQIGVTEYPTTTQKCNRTICISEVAGDMDVTRPGNFGRGGASTTSFQVALIPNDFGTPVLKPGTLYYVNVANRFRGQNSCLFNNPAGASCDLRLEITR